MANHFSALKRVRVEARRTEFNRQAKTRLRHQIRAMRKALAGKEHKVTTEEMAKTFSLIDRSAQSGIIKKNAAARYKSRLHARVKAALAK
jgi:small subunit ribosomal protein S20